MTRRILVVRGGALGDFVLGLPALEMLRGAFPDARLGLVGPGSLLPLARPLVDASAPLDRAEYAALFGDGAHLPESLVERYADLDLVVLWMGDPEGAVRRNFARLGARRVLQAPALPQGPGVHAADHLMATLAGLGGEGRGVAVPRVSPGPDARRAADALWGRLGLPDAGRVLAIHPGSGGRWKCWPAERFARVAEALARAGVRPVVIQGPADDEVVGRLLGATRDRMPVVAGLEVEALASFLARCSAYLGNDSGVTHLAAATGTPVVVVFGPTDPAVWGPRGPRVAVLREGESLEAVTVDQVVMALSDIL